MSKPLPDVNVNYKSREQDQLVLTDEFRFRDIFWEFYYGYLEMKRQYNVRLMRGMDVNTQRIGMFSYLAGLIDMLHLFIMDFESELRIKGYDLEQYHKILKVGLTPDKYPLYEDQDFYFLEDLMQGFLKISGWINILRKGIEKMPASIMKYED